MTPQRWGNDDRWQASRGQGHHGPRRGERRMSSDPTQPVPEWWQQPQAPKKEPGGQKDRDRDPQDSQATRQYPTSQGSPASPARPTFTPSQGNQPDQRYQSGQGYPSDQGYPSGPGFPSGSGYQQEQDYPGNQGY